MKLISQAEIRAFLALPSTVYQVQRALSRAALRVQQGRQGRWRFKWIRTHEFHGCRNQPMSTGFCHDVFFFLSKLGYKKQHLSSKLVLSNGSDIMAAAAAILARPCAREGRCVKFRGGAVRTSYRLSRLIFFEVSLSQNWVI
jgi:hypothetical protein